MRNSSTNLLRKSSAIFGVILFATPTGASISMDAWAPVSDTELAGKRGAYITKSGLEIEFGAKYYAIIDGTFQDDLDASINQTVEGRLHGNGPKVEVVVEPALPEVNLAVEAVAPFASVADVAAAPGLPIEHHVDVMPELPLGSAPQAAGAALSFAKAVMDVPQQATSPGAQGHMAASPAQSHANLGGSRASLAPSPGTAAAKTAAGPPVALVSSSKAMPEPALPPTPAASMRARVEFENEFVVGDGGGVQQKEINLGQTRIVQRVSADGVVGLVLNTANDISIRQFVEIQIHVRNFSEVFENPARLNARAASRLMNRARFHSIQ